MELRPFAAPRNEDMWADLRPRLAADAARRGGTATEVDGPVRSGARSCVLTGTDEQGARGDPAVGGVGHRRTPLAAAGHGLRTARPRVSDEDGALERALREVVVVRGHRPDAAR